MADGGLTLIPLVAGQRASIVDDDSAALRHVGIPRARILRELERPSTNKGIAAALQTVPTAATHHLSALEAAGVACTDSSIRSPA